MSGLRIMTAVLPSLAPSAAADADKSSAGSNAAFTGVLDRVATRPAAADPQSSQDSVGLGSSAKRARSDATTSGSDEPDADEPEEDSLASTTAPPGTTTLDISTLAQAALVPIDSTATKSAGPAAIPEGDQGSAKIAATATAALQAIVQQPVRPTASEIGANQSTGPAPSGATATSTRTDGPSAIPEGDQGPAQIAATATAALQAILQQPVRPTSSESGADRSTGSTASPATTARTPASPSSTGVLGTAQGQPASASAATAQSPAGAILASMASGSTSVASAIASTPFGTTGSATGSAVASQQTREADAARTAGSASQSSQSSTDAAQAAAAATALQPPSNTPSLPASVPVGAAVRTSAQPTPSASLRAGTDGSVKSALPETTASSLDSASGKRGKDKTASTPVVAAASSDLPVVATPAQQVLTALQSLGKDVAGSAARRATASTTASADVSTPQSSGPSSLKTLTVQLNPAHLGPVSITLRLLADTMDIRIAVSNPDTLHLLDKDKHLLAAAVEAMGGSGDNLQVGTLAQMSDSGDSAATGGQNQNTPGRQDAPSSDTSSNGRQAQGQSRSTLPDTSQSDADEPTATPPLPQARVPDGSLYL